MNGSEINLYYEFEALEVTKKNTYIYISKFDSIDKRPVLC